MWQHLREVRKSQYHVVALSAPILQKHSEQHLSGRDSPCNSIGVLRVERRFRHIDLADTRNDNTFTVSVSFKNVSCILPMIFENDTKLIHQFTNPIPLESRTFGVKVEIFVVYPFIVYQLDKTFEGILYW